LLISLQRRPIPKQAVAERAAPTEKKSELPAPAAQTQKEELTPQPKPGTVVGGAWFTRANGNSEVIRGLHVSLLRPKTRKKDASQLFVNAEGLSCGRLELYEKELNRPGLSEREQARKSRLVKLARGTVKVLRSYRELADEASLDTERVLMVLRSPDAVYSAWEDTFTVLTREQREPTRFVRLSLLTEDPWWTALIRDMTLTNAATSIEGKYAIENLPAGRYCLYAAYWTGSLFMEWVITVDVGAGAYTTVDLSNANAHLIVQRLP